MNELDALLDALTILATAKRATVRDAGPAFEILHSAYARINAEVRAYVRGTE